VLLDRWLPHVSLALLDIGGDVQRLDVVGLTELVVLVRTAR
jgi:hypothetical protein